MIGGNRSDSKNERGFGFQNDATALFQAFLQNWKWISIFKPYLASLFREKVS